MINLFYLNDSFTNSIYDIVVSILFISSIICGISVIISKNPIVSVLFLIGLFLTIAMYLIASGISFIGLSYLLVYVGAVSILFLFILMLINVRVSELVTDNNNSIPLSIIIITIIGVTFQDKVLSFSNTPSFTSNNDNIVYYASSLSWDSSMLEVSHISSIGNILYTSYPILLLVTSMILLLAMVGAIIITIKQ